MLAGLMLVALAVRPAGAAQPPYDKDLLRLAEILGAVHYLRTLCKAPDGAAWRLKMEALIEAEKPSLTRKRRMIARFNLGYRSFEQTHRSCTAQAAEAANRYVEEGATLARRLTARYGR
jgi:uncharacterized protein (TIGR02301 family)